MLKKSYDYLFKILLIGDSGVGKTCILFKFCDGSFNSSFISTIGIDFKVKTIELDGKIVKLQIWDTAGQERFRTITLAYYRNSNGILLVYDVTNRKSFENIEHWIKNIEQNANPSVKKILLANKCDKEKERKVTAEESLELASRYSIEHYETSAISGLNIEDPFLRLTQLIKNDVETQSEKIELIKSDYLTTLKSKKSKSSKKSWSNLC